MSPLKDVRTMSENFTEIIRCDDKGVQKQVNISLASEQN